MTKLPAVKRVCDIRMGDSPLLESWIYHFLVENNIEFFLSPSIVASPEQLRFMVAMDDDQIYIPCDDKLFLDIYTRKVGPIDEEYKAAWQFIENMIDSYSLSKNDARRILNFCRYRFDTYNQMKIVLPSRVIKRLVGIVLTQCGESDPFRVKKRYANEVALSLMNDERLQKELNKLPDNVKTAHSVGELRNHLDLVETKRLMQISVYPSLHHGTVSAEDLCKTLQDVDDDVSALVAAFPGVSRKILLIPDRAGGIVFDIMLAKSLIRQGHKVILVLKDAFYFSNPTVFDYSQDPVLRELLEEAHFIENQNITKNDLLQALRENSLVIISDGTVEQLNLYRTSVTFARAWRECDLVIAKGRRNKKVLIDTSHSFTRNILSYYRNEEGEPALAFKPRAPWVVKVAEKDLLNMSNKIIRSMREAKQKGQKVMFYSAIIGSVPGQTKVAVSLVTTFVDYLRKKLENTFIINPAEHFSEGLDGDDLMFMWEHVQRSGLLDVWRFQTAEDIEKSFFLMRNKIPSVWLGKDSTFSTGCTKEMRIALDVQRSHPELQIIGPQPERFFRRRDYGIGKYYDATLSG